MTQKDLSTTSARTISCGNIATSLLIQMKNNNGNNYNSSAIVGQSAVVEHKHWMARRELLLQTLDDAILLLEE
jgi:hypothetical protein